MNEGIIIFLIIVVCAILLFMFIIPYVSVSIRRRRLLTNRWIAFSKKIIEETRSKLCNLSEPPDEEDEIEICIVTRDLVNDFSSMNYPHPKYGVLSISFFEDTGELIVEGECAKFKFDKGDYKAMIEGIMRALAKMPYFNKKLSLDDSPKSG